MDVLDLSLLALQFSPVIFALGAFTGLYYHPLTRVWIQRKLFKKNKGVVSIAVKGARQEAFVTDLNQSLANCGELGTYVLNPKKVYLMKGVPFLFYNEGDTEPVRIEEIKAPGKEIDARGVSAIVSQVYEIAATDAWKNVEWVKKLLIIGLVLIALNAGLTVWVKLDVITLANALINMGAQVKQAIPFVG